MTTAQLEEITGLDLQDGRTLNDYGGVSQCRWDRARGTPDGVSISLHDNGNIANYTAMPGSLAVSGLGNEAVWNEEINQLAVRKGAAVLSISLLYPPPQLELTKRIAGLAVPRVGAAPVHVTHQ